MVAQAIQPLLARDNAMAATPSTSTTPTPTPTLTALPAPPGETPTPVSALFRPRRRSRWWIAGGVGAGVLVVVGLVVLLWPKPAEAPTLITATVTRGALSVFVTATGNLAPMTQVEVGSELSGVVDAVFVDDNAVVTRGQVLARLDTQRLNDAVVVAEAQLAQATAQVQVAQATEAESTAQLARLRDVFLRSGGKVPSQAELATAEAAALRAGAAVASARAGVLQAKANAQSMRTNLERAEIRSPIDGIVLDRTVEPGQTVAASLQAPVLFTLAEDLKTMELVVHVDEADVGGVDVGLAAGFSVDAWPDERFAARVARVSYAATTANNVVSYEATLAVDNASGRLRPGMTGTAEIETVHAKDAVLVPNAALRFVSSTASTSTASTATSTAAGPAAPAPSRNVFSMLMPRRPGAPGKSTTTSKKTPGRGVLTVREPSGPRGETKVDSVRRVEVTLGASDGVNTVVTGVVGVDGAADVAALAALVGAEVAVGEATAP